MSHKTSVERLNVSPDQAENRMSVLEDSFAKLVPSDSKEDKKIGMNSGKYKRPRGLHSMEGHLNTRDITGRRALAEGRKAYLEKVEWNICLPGAIHGHAYLGCF